MAAGGSVDSPNYDYYMYTGEYYWTMSPSLFVDGNAVEWLVSNGGYFSSDFVNYTFGVRPVLSLKSDITVTGTGTQNGSTANGTATGTSTVQTQATAPKTGDSNLGLIVLLAGAAAVCGAVLTRKKEA